MSQRLFKQDFWAEGKYLGSSERAAELVHNSVQPPESLAYFCTACGDIWARIVVPGQEFRVWSQPCRRHQPKWRVVVAGSMFQEWNRPLNDSFPRGALLREVLLTADWFEKYYWREDLLKGELI